MHRTLLFSLFSLFSLLCLLPSRAFADFTISYWCGPPAKFLSQDRFNEVKEANFTLAFPACAGMTPEQNRKMLDYCHAAGLKAIIMDGRMPHAISGDANAKPAIDAIVKDFADHPALLGYHIIDEPGAHAFPALAEVMAYLKEKDPKHPGYINLLPSYGRDHNVLGTKTYEEYVRKYADIVKPSVISYDHYHFLDYGDRKNPAGEIEFFENLDTIRKVALEKNIPFWNIVLLTKHGAYRHLTEPELRFEAMQTLAHGASGLIWFTYWSPAGFDSTFDWHHAMINPDGSRDPHYDMVKVINADVLAYAQAMRGAKSTEIRSPLGDRKNSPLTVGHFKTEDNRDLRFIANTDYKKPTTIPFAIPSQKAERFDPATKKWNPVEAETKDGKSHVTLTLPPGDAALLRW